MKYTPHHQIAIIGAGFSGVGAAIRLKQRGYHDLVVLERADEIGGTWRDNTYPGCACDVESHLYSFSFAPNPNWSEMYAHQPEILAYLKQVVDRYQLRPLIRFNHAVTSAAWDAQAKHWHIETNDGTFTANFLIAGYGPLAEPRLPNIPGLATFSGRYFHSARWDHSHSLQGERVAVIGTGASAVQFIPQIQPMVARLDVFQRTPAWVVPRLNRPITQHERQRFRRIPLAQRWERFKIYCQHEIGVFGFYHPKAEAIVAQTARLHLESQVADPALRAKLTPHYAIGCKRITVSDDYYPALTQPNVTLITDAIQHIHGNQIITSDGAARTVDTLILGTGFHVAQNPSAALIHGRDCRSLAEVWNGSPQAYLGMSVANFPNLFLLVGPNTGLGHSSIIFMIEAQINYILQSLDYVKRHRLAVLEVFAQRQAEYNAAIQQQLSAFVWSKGGCNSWYLDANGHNSTLWPGFTFRYRQRTWRFDPMAYQVQTF